MGVGGGLQQGQDRGDAGVGALEETAPLVAGPGPEPGGQALAQQRPAVAVEPVGQVVGATDVRGFAAVERVLSPENFASTVYAKLGIDPGKLLYAPNGRPTHLVSDPTPIRELMG